jgi:hypothetical protein
LREVARGDGGGELGGGGRRAGRCARLGKGSGGSMEGRILKGQRAAEGCGDRHEKQKTERSLSTERRTGAGEGGGGAGGALRVTGEGKERR